MNRPERGRWPGQPERCTAKALIVATLEETLDCPFGWWYAPGLGWLHPLPGIQP